MLFGLNGAGKTTTVSTIAGLLKPDAGAIRFDGKEIAGRSPTQLVGDGIALVPEGRRVFPALSVANNLRLGAWTRRRHRAEVEQRRELVFEYFPRLAERADQAAGTLSGGEQQMLAIGRALMSKPAAAADRRGVARAQPGAGQDRVPGRASGSTTTASR